MKRRVFGYVRISHQEPGGVSLDQQRSKIDAYAQVTDREPIHEIIADDGYTGANLSRPGFQRLATHIERGEASAVIVNKLDRLSRSLADVLHIIALCEKHKTAVLSVSESLDTTTPVGRLLVHVLASFGEFERHKICERTRDALAHKRHTGAVYGPVAFGYRQVGRRLVPDATEQSMLAEMRALRDDGNSYQRIADVVTAGTWTCHRVRGVLTSRIAQEVA